MPKKLVMPMSEKFVANIVEQQIIRDIRELEPSNAAMIVTLLNHLLKPGGVARISLSYVCARCGGPLRSSLRVDPKTNAWLCKRCGDKAKVGKTP